MLHDALKLFMGPVLVVLSITAQALDLPAKFDPSRDAARDVATAIVGARQQGKRVLVDVGGNWCPWCHILDTFMEEHDDVRALRDSSYVWVKVNWSPDNKNQAVLSKWPAIRGYPHLYVLDSTGTLVTSQDTGELEEGNSYSPAKMMAFLRRHAP